MNLKIYIIYWKVILLGKLVITCCKGMKCIIKWFWKYRSVGFKFLGRGCLIKVGEIKGLLKFYFLSKLLF